MTETFTYNSYKLMFAFCMQFDGTRKSAEKIITTYPTYFKLGIVPQPSDPDGTLNPVQYGLIGTDNYYHKGEWHTNPLKEKWAIKGNYILFVGEHKYPQIILKDVFEKSWTKIGEAHLGRWY